MLKGQDIVLLVKLITNKEARSWSQAKLAEHLCMSSSTINASLKALSDASIVHKKNTYMNPYDVSLVNIYDINEFLIKGIKYFFSAEKGTITCGIPTSCSAPLMKEIFTASEEELVWPYAEGTVRGVALKPFYHTVPESVVKYPDEPFYEMLYLMDVLRSGNYREKEYAIKLISERIGKCL